MYTKYGRTYSEHSLWTKLRKSAKKAGAKVVYASLLLFYALKDPRVPMKAKSVIVGALGYLIVPLDLLPDFIPFAGFTDDFGSLMVAIGVVAVYINDEIRTKAKQKMSEWFGQASARDIVEVERTIEQSKHEQ